MRTAYYKLLTKAISRLLKTPQFLILYLTNDCWMKCRHCFYNESFRETNQIQSEILTFEQLELLAASIKKILYLSLTGGEPFIREDLEDIVKLFTKKNKVFRYQIPTSGYKPDFIVGKVIKILNDNPAIPFRVHVSLDGNKEIQTIVRGKRDSFENAVETIKQLDSLKKKYDNFDVSVVTTICNYNQFVFEELSRIVQEILPEGEWCINIIRGDPRNPAAKDIGFGSYLNVSQLIEQRNRNSSYKGYTGHLTSSWLSAKNAARRKIIYRILQNKYKGGGCSAGSIGGVIYPDGSVYPCESLNIPIGNLKDFEYSLPRLWNSINADKLRNWIQDTRCVCTHECSLSTNFLIQPRTWPALMYERAKMIIR